MNRRQTDSLDTNAFAKTCVLLDNAKMRESLTACENECVALKSRIAHLESHVVTDNSKTLVNALDRIKALESLIHAHNEMCVIMCNDKKDCGFAPYDRDCGNCHKDYIIDAILPATEVDNGK